MVTDNFGIPKILPATVTWKSNKGLIPSKNDSIVFIKTQRLL